VGPVSNSNVRRSTWIISALILALIGLAIPVVRHLREVPPPPPPALALTLGAPPGTELGSGDEPLDAAISPDERHIVFVAARGGTTTLWRRALQSDRAEALAGTEGAQLPAWNRTGNAVLFFAGGHLRQLELGDGKVIDIADAAFPAGTTSLLDGSILFAPQSAGVIRQARDGQITDATTLRPGDRAHAFPFATGTGNDFVYTAVAENGRRTVRLVHNREERDLSATSGHGQIVGGYLLVVRDDVLLAQRVEESGALGRSIPLITGVGATSTGRSLFVASPRIVLSSASSTRARELTWFDINGMRISTMGESGDLWQVRLAPNDRYAAVTLTAPLLRTLDITIVPAASGAPSQSLTLALAADSDPVWSPDGRRVLFKSLQTGRPTLFMKRAHDKDADDETVVEGDATPTDWRESAIVAHIAEASSGQDVVAIDAASHTRATIVKSGFNDTDGRWSPDGASIAYVSDESGRQDIYIHRRDDDRVRADSDANRREGPRVRVSFGGGTRPRWSRDGRSIFFLRGSTIMRATLTNSTPASFAAAVPVLDAPGIRDFDVAHQRDALLAIVPVGSASSVPVSVMVDWQSTIPSTP
jgi:Tol biopolymer transport system component